MKLANEPQNAWMKPAMLSDKEQRFYHHHLGEGAMRELFAADQVIPLSALQ